MITNFEEFTYEITLHEKLTILPIIKDMLEHAIGKDQAVTNHDIISKIQSKGYKTSPSRVRKIIHELRINHSVKRLIATSKGYYISVNKEELMNYLVSLFERIHSISEVREALAQDYDEFTN